MCPRALTGLCKALTALPGTPEVSQGTTTHRTVELSKVSLPSDSPAPSVREDALSAEQNARTQALLQRSGPHRTHLLMSQRTPRNVPATAFVQDKAHTATGADRLLAIANFGPP